MNKGIKKIAKIGLIVVLVFIAIPALSLLFLQNRHVQTRLTQYVTARLSEELQASISISSVSYSFLRRIQIRDLYIEDLQGDTLLYTGLAKLRIKQFRPEPPGLTFRKATLEDVFVNLVIDSTGFVNIQHFTHQLKRTETPEEPRSRVLFTSIDLTNARFSLKKLVRPARHTPWQVTNFHLRDLEITVNDLEVYRDTVRMDVAALSGMESSGFEISSITTLLSISKNHLHFDNLAVRTDRSDLQVPALWFDFENFRKFKRFSYEVDLLFRSRESLLHMEDFAYFVPEVGTLLDHLIIDGKVSGKLSDMKGDNLVLTFDDQSSLACDFMMIGLPDVQNTFVDFNFRDLNTSARAISELAGTSPDTSSQSISRWMNLGTLDFTGRFTGYPDDFVASGLLATQMGRMVMDLSFKPDSARGVEFLGRMRAHGFELGSFFNIQEIGRLDMNVYADGNLYRGEINADLEGTIDTLEFHDYAYSNITLDAAFTNRTFDGGFSISDPNIKLDFLGRIDFSGEVPVHKFTADVARARPYYLNLPESDPGYFASFLIETDLSGRNIDELNGEIKLINSLFEKSDAHVQLYDVSVIARNTPEASLIQLRSGLLDADVTGQYKLTSLPASFRNMADHYLNVIPRAAPCEDTTNYFVFEIDIKHLSPLLNFFYPVLEISDGSRLSGTYDPVNTDIGLKGSFPALEIAGNRWHQCTTSAHAGEEVFQWRFSSDSMIYREGYLLNNQEIALDARSDTAYLDITWDNGVAPVYRGKISLQGSFQPDSLEDLGFQVELEPGILVIHDNQWNIHRSSMLIKRHFFRVDNFDASSTGKRILANGTISSEEGQEFLLEVQNLDLAAVDELSGINAELTGAATGHLNYRRSKGIPVINSSLMVDSLSFNSHYMGKTEMVALWDDLAGTLNARLISRVGENKSVEVSGAYIPGNRSVDFDISLDSFSLSALNPYTAGVVHDLNGAANLNLTLDGTIDTPELNGTVDFEQGAATFDFINTRYILNDQVRIYHNNVYLEDFRVEDQFGHGGRVNGSVANTHLKDFYISLNIDADNVQCMNTTSGDNEVFYGTIFGTGNLRITGPPDNIRLNINAATEKNTALYLPLYNASEVTTSDFITFVLEEDLDVPESSLARARNIGGLELELEVDVTNEATVQLIFDPKVGDIIETSGNGNLRITLDKSSGFSMYGDVVLDKGDYLFTLQNVINKRFKIEPGGKISFNGAPMDASIDLEAIYTTRAAPYNLYPDFDDTRESLKKRIPVECHLVLQDDLKSPTISTGIYMPTADAETRNLLENATSTDEELMKQFLSLLVINNFYSVTGFGTQDVGTTGSIAGVTASELLSNQLSNWLSQISDDFDIGVNYRPGDEITRDEVEVALSTQLLDDRVIISGNVDVGGQETNPSTDASNTPYIMGDFDVEFRVTDNVSIIAFNRARDELLFETAPYKQGVGISYKEEFNNLKQLIARYREGIANRKKKRKNKREAESGE